MKVSICLHLNPGHSCQLYQLWQNYCKYKLKRVLGSLRVITKMFSVNLTKMTLSVGQQRDVRSVSRSSSRSDRNPTYMNTTQPTYQNHVFETQEQWHDRQDWLDRQEWEEVHHNTMPPSHKARWGDARRGDWHDQPPLRQNEFVDPSFEQPGVLWRGRHGGGYGYSGAVSTHSHSRWLINNITAFVCCI